MSQGKDGSKGEAVIVILLVVMFMQSIVSRVKALKETIYRAVGQMVTVGNFGNIVSE